MLLGDGFGGINKKFGKTAYLDNYQMKLLGPFWAWKENGKFCRTTSSIS